MRNSIMILIILLLLMDVSCKKENNPDQQPLDTTNLMPTGLVPATEEELLSLPTIESLDTSLIPYLKSAEDLPPDIELEMPPVEQQIGYSCVGWAMGYGMLSYYFKFFEGHSDYDGLYRIFSPNYIWNQLNSHLNKGISMYQAILLVQNQGCCKMAYMPKSFPFDELPSASAIENAKDYPITQFYVFSEININRMKLYLSKGNPIVIGVSVDNEFKDIDNKSQYEKQSDGRLVWKKYASSISDKHAMLICGYDDDIHAFKVLNSWGTTFGNNGYIWIDYDFFKDIVNLSETSTPSDVRFEIYVGLIFRPLVYTNSSGSISSYSTTCTGKVAADYTRTVTERGICWNTASDPTIADNKKASGTGTGNYTVTITGLSANTKYFYKAYAINSAGISYGMEASFTTSESQLSVPILTTTEVTDPTQTSATSGGNISSDGGAPVTARGVCWNTTGNPTIDDDHTSDGTGTGSFTSSITGLTPNTPYYVKAYATNSAGPGYGDQQSFTTSGSQSFTIGEEYGGGVIFYIDNTGKHGLISTKTDVSTACYWYNGSFVETGATAKTIGNGLANTEKVVSVLGNGNYAAKICMELSLNGYSDWYLPCQKELDELFDLTGNYALPDYTDYWSSTESGGTGFGAGAYFRNNWSSGYGGANYTARVRAVRAF